MKYREPQRFILLQEKEMVEKSRLGTNDQRLLIEQLIVSPLQQLTQYTTVLDQVCIMIADS